jgi:hypothetical protein
MGTDGKTEACGRCSMTSVMGLTEGEDDASRNPFEGDRIELSDDQLRTVSPHVVALGRLKNRLDEWATAFTYGR